MTRVPLDVSLRHVLALSELCPTMCKHKEICDFNATVRFICDLTQQPKLKCIISSVHSSKKIPRDYFPF